MFNMVTTTSFLEILTLMKFKIRPVRMEIIADDSVNRGKKGEDSAYEV